MASIELRDLHASDFIATQLYQGHTITYCIWSEEMDIEIPMAGSSSHKHSWHRVGPHTLTHQECSISLWVLTMPNVFILAMILKNKTAFSF